MSLSTIRRAGTVRRLAGTVLTAALLVPAATACSSSSGTRGAAAPTTAAAATTPGAAPTAAPAATTPAAPGTPAASATHGATAPTATPSGRATTAPAPGNQPKPGGQVRTETLVDGSTAEIRTLGDQHYLAKVVNDGQVLATLETKGHDDGLDGNGMFVVLSLDGRIHSWMGGAHQGPGTFKLAGGWTARVTRTGDLHYRAEILGADNAVYGTLEANQHDAGVDANAVHIVLSAGGEISAHE